MPRSIDVDKCVGCEQCVEMCPVGAIRASIIKDDKGLLTWVDKDSCIDCGGCECPFDAIKKNGGVW